MAKLFGSFPLFGEGASFANTKCEPVVQRIRMRDVGFVLQLFFLCDGFGPYWLQFFEFFEVGYITSIRLLPFVAVALDFVLINVTTSSRHKTYYQHCF